MREALQQAEQKAKAENRARTPEDVQEAVSLLKGPTKKSEDAAKKTPEQPLKQRTVTFTGVDRDAVSFRLDVPAFFKTLSARQRGMAEDLMLGTSTGEVAERHGVSASAVSQFRIRFRALFNEFFSR